MLGPDMRGDAAGVRAATVRAQRARAGSHVRGPALSGGQTPTARSPRTGFRDAHLELHDLAFSQTPEAVRVQVALRRQAGSTRQTGSPWGRGCRSAHLVHEHVVSALTGDET